MNQETNVHIAHMASTLNDGMNNLLPSDAVDAISAIFNEKKLRNVDQNIENYDSHKPTSIIRPPINLNNCVKGTLETDVINLKTEITQDVLNVIKAEASEGIPVKASDELLQHNDLQSEHLVYTTLDNIKPHDENSENSNVQQFQPIKQESMFSIPDFNPQLQLRRYPFYPNNYTPMTYSGSSCPSVTNADLNLNYVNDMQPSQLRWMQGKQQVQANTPSPCSMPTSLIFDVFPETEYAAESTSTSSPSLLSSFTSESSPNVQNIVSPNVNNWNVSSQAPIVLGPTGQALSHFQDASGNVQYYATVMNDRESHNMKERERRARVTRMCSKMRMIIPGVTETTDKATVFQRGAAYINFLLGKMGRRCDHELKALIRNTDPIFRSVKQVCFNLIDNTCANCETLPFIVCAWCWKHFYLEKHYHD